MQQGDGPDGTRRFEPPDGRSGQGEPGGPDVTRRMAGADTGGEILGDRYRLQEFLGSGGMADVYRARDVRLNRPVAVKIFRPGTEPDGERRFVEEARLLANLSHPGLVAVHDFGVEQQRAYLVMELVDGWTMRELRDRQRLPLEEVARIGAALAGALSYVHEQGVVHRDVTPSNVLLGREGRVQLADFGISRLVDATGLTGRDEIVGTASYLAPEQAQGARVGPQADVYALGLVLLEAITGRVEYPGGGWETAAERLSRAPEVPTNVPAPLRRALLAMTEMDPSRRPTAAQAARMLARGGTGDTGRRPARRSHAPRNVAIALGVVALAAILIALAFTGDGEEPGAAQPTAPPTATGEPAGDDAGAGESPEQGPAGEQPADEGPGTETTADEPGLPDLPSFDMPDVPEPVREDATSAWERFRDWLASWF